MDRLKFRINVHQDTQLIRQRPYSYSQQARAEIERQIQEMLAIKFILHSISLWASNSSVKKWGATFLYRLPRAE